MHLKTKLIATFFLQLLLLGPIGSADAIDRVWSGQLLTDGWADAFFVTNWFNPNDPLDNGIPDADDVAIFDEASAQSSRVVVDPGRTVQAVEFVGEGFRLSGSGSPLTLTTGNITTSNGVDNGLPDNVIFSDLILTDNGIWDIGSHLQVERIRGGKSIVKRGNEFLVIGSTDPVEPSTLDRLLIIDGSVVVTGVQVTANALDGSGEFTVQNGGTFVLAGSQDSTFSGTLSTDGTGTNVLVKSGSGALTLSGNNSFDGVVSFDEGAIVATNDNSLGSARVLETGGTSTLEYQAGITLSNQIDTSSIRLQVTSGTATHSGLVMGSGSVTKTGSGTLALTGANFYAGGTTISAGKLRVSTSSLPSAGGVVNNAELEFAQPSNATYAGAISGSGSFTKSGNGQLTLTGNNPYEGTTFVDEGTLFVAATTGSATGTGQVRITGGATFGGTGLSSGTTVNSGGTLAPSVSDGQLTLGGLSLGSGSTWKMGVGEGLGNHLIVLDSASLGGNLVIDLLDGFVPELSDMFTLLTADTLVGALANVADGSRLDTLDGEGSFLVRYNGTNNSVVLSEFAVHGDFDFDGDIDGADFLLWQRNPSIGDLADWQSNFGIPSNSIAASSSTVPEPRSMAILLVFPAAMAGCCRFGR